MVRLLSAKGGSPEGGHCSIVDMVGELNRRELFSVFIKCDYITISIFFYFILYLFRFLLFNNLRIIFFRKRLLLQFVDSNFSKRFQTLQIFSFGFAPVALF